jgi:hypothetical protein
MEKAGKKNLASYMENANDDFGSDILVGSVVRLLALFLYILLCFSGAYWIVSAL